MSLSETRFRSFEHVAEEPPGTVLVVVFHGIMSNTLTWLYHRPHYGWLKYTCRLQLISVSLVAMGRKKGLGYMMLQLSCYMISERHRGHVGE